MSQSDEWVNKDVRVPDGAYFGQSNGTPDSESSLLFDRESGKTLGPAELRDPQHESESDSEKVLAAISFAIGAVVTLVVVKGPDIKRGWDDRVLPAIKEKWATAFKTREADSQAAATEDESSDETGQAASAGRFLTLVDLEADMPGPGRADPGPAAPAA